MTSGRRDGFGARLRRAMDRYGPLCVGIDPHPELLAAWDLPADPAGLERFALGAVDALAGQVGVFKPQSAFFEAHGAAGIAVLERTLAAVRDAGRLTVLDVKRGDIGSTVSAYAAAYLEDGAPLVADAVTLAPYSGVDGLEPAFSSAERAGRGVFVLARTSTAEGRSIQLARTAAGPTVGQHVLDRVARRNAGVAPLGPVGVVVGATGEHGLDLSGLNGPILAPGLGAQGATPSDLPRMFGAAIGRVLPAASRSVLGHGPEPAALRAAVVRLRDELAMLPGLASDRG